MSLSFDERKQLLELEYELQKKAIMFQHERKLEQIRLETANKRRIEEFKRACIEETRRGKKGEQNY